MKSEVMHTVNVRVTHKKAELPILEAVSFADIEEALEKLKKIPSIEGAVIIQTCNRVEIFAAAKNVSHAHHDLLDFLMGETISKFKRASHAKVSPEMQSKIVEHVIEMSKKIHDAIEVDYHANAVLHLMRLACGLESMIMGEDQILGQIKDSFELAEKHGMVNDFLSLIFKKAINVGKRARKETKINEGAVSIGSAAIELAEKEIGELKDKNILVIGAGDMGKLVSKSLCELDIKNITIANRTLRRAEKLAKMLGGRAVGFENLGNEIEKSDVIITATGAKERIIKKSELEKIMERRKAKPLYIFDVANPRDVEERVREIPNVKLFNIDSLREIAEENMRKREREITRVEEIIEEEFKLLEEKLYHIDVERIIKTIFETTEKIRKEEVEKALRMLGNGVDSREKEIIDDLTRVILKRTLAPIIQKMRIAAEINDREAIEAAEMYFMENGRKRKKN